jgi:cellulose synthase/poly-beta-1,6-N-acetylglucosamine synthase-like glycosyltransferase
VNLVEKKSRAILVPEAQFYTAFPATWRAKVGMKLRRANQLVRVLWQYIRLLLKRRMQGSKRLIVQSALTYLVSPVMFILLAATTVFLILNFPYSILLFLVLLIPKARFYLLEVIQNYLVLFVSMLAVAFNKRFVVWDKSEDRVWIKEKMLRQYGLI